jgi:hypothetical protein
MVYWTDNDHNELEKLILVQCPGITFNRNPFRSLDRNVQTDWRREKHTACLITLINATHDMQGPTV